MNNLYTHEKQDKVKWIITFISLGLIADSNWINSEERVLPVTIDPQIITSNSTLMTLNQYTLDKTTNTESFSSSITLTLNESSSQKKYGRIEVDILKVFKF